MELLLALLALVLAAVGLGLAVRLRGDVAQAQQAADSARREADRALQQGAEGQATIAALRQEIGQLQTELAGLRAIADSPPPLTLPKARRAGGLDDLREELRSAQQEATEQDEG